MRTINIFCIIGKTGTGKTTFLNNIINDTKFMTEVNLNPLKYGTTRSIRENESGTEYNFLSIDEFEAINKDNLVECRKYNTISGDVYYFTKEEYLSQDNNIICTASPYQCLSYKEWIENNTNTDIKYNLHIIYILLDIKTRVSRLMNRSCTENDIYEFMRRILDERVEFEQASRKYPKLNSNKKFVDVCYIHNDNYGYESENQNSLMIKEFIKTKINEIS